MDFSFQIEQETAGRWLAEVPELPGVLAYSAFADEATIRAETLALRTISDRMDHGETKLQSIRLLLAA